jgi:hypothetical protein
MTGSGGNLAVRVKLVNMNSGETDRTETLMDESAPAPSTLLIGWIGQVVVVDLRSPYVCLGKLVGVDTEFLDIRDADLHDFRDSPATREVYVFDSARLGIRRNRARVLVRRDEVVAVSRVADVSES